MKEICGNSYFENDYVCKYSDGQRLQPSNLTKRWRNFLKKNGLPPITFHDLRHLSVSLLISLGFSLIEAQQWLGHADIKSTMIYAHLEVGNKEKIISKVPENLIIPKKLEAPKIRCFKHQIF